MIYDLKNSFEVESSRNYLCALIAEKCTITIVKKRKRRTIRQNSYLHVIISLFAVYFGYTLDEAKTLLKRECHFMRYDKKGSTFLKSTSLLNTSELTSFIDFIRNYSSIQGCYLPDSEEYLLQNHYFDKEIESNKAFL